MTLPRILEKYRTAIDDELKAIVDSRSLALYGMMRYHLGWIDENGKPAHNNSGKALRPALCLFSCEAVDGDFLKALPAAAAIELVHNFSLIHDDIQDDDQERRHRPTVWAIWGKPQAINAGTAMRILAGTALARLEKNGISILKQCYVNQRLDEISLRLIEGQFLDISFENRFDIKVIDYLTMIEGKTAALISGSMEIGAYLGTEEHQYIDNFKNIGNDLGLAFQIKDDILGIWGNGQETGKPAGNDIRRRKKSFPMVYALDNVNGSLRKELITIYQKASLTNNDINNVLNIFDHLEVKKKAQQTVERYSNEARHVYNSLKLSKPLRDNLDELIEFLTVRNF